MTITTNHWLASLGLLLNRVSLGMYFAVAGYGKLFEMGSEAWLEHFFSVQPAWLPDWFTKTYGHALPYVEIVAGAILVLGLLGRVASAIMALLLISFIIAVTDIFPKGFPFQPNIILLTLALLLTMLGPGGWSIDRVIFRKRRQAL